MIEIKIGSITTECFRPRSEERAFTTNFHLGRLTLGFFGTDAVALCRKIAATGGIFSDKDAKRINKYFFDSSRKIYNLPNSTHPQSFYTERSKDAIEAVNYFGELVPELAEDFELKEEISDLEDSDRPSDLLRYLASPIAEGENSPPGFIDQTLAYEAQRHAIILHQLGTIEARALKLRNIRSNVQNLLNEKLFMGPEGKGRPFYSESFHDDETNTVVGFPDRGTHQPLTAHLKKRWIKVREVPEVGLIHEKSRRKGIGQTLAKTWVKALHNSGLVHIDDAVQDSIGMRFVLMDDNVPPQQFADLVASIIEAGAKERFEANHPCVLPEIERIEDDPETGTDHGQSTALNFNARRKIWFKDIPTPMELIFYDRETYLNSELEVGERSQETGLYKGRGHELFELRRGIEVIRLPFTQEIYKESDDDRIQRAFINQSKQKAYGMRNRYRAA